MDKYPSQQLISFWDLTYNLLSCGMLGFFWGEKGGIFRDGILLSIKFSFEFLLGYWRYILIVLWSQVSVPAWFTADTRLGSLSINLDTPQCFSAEIYSEDLNIVGKPEDHKVRCFPGYHIRKSDLVLTGYILVYGDTMWHLTHFGYISTQNLYLFLSLIHLMYKRLRVLIIILKKRLLYDCCRGHPEINRCRLMHINQI